MKISEGTKFWLRLLNFYVAVFSLTAVGAYMTWMAAEGPQPYWWYPAMRGIVVAACLIQLALVLAMKSWLSLLAVPYAGVAGIFLWLDAGRAQWEPIDRFTAVLLALTAVFYLFPVVGIAKDRESIAKNSMNDDSAKPSVE